MVRMQAAPADHQALEQDVRRSATPMPPGFQQASPPQNVIVHGRYLYVNPMLRQSRELEFDKQGGERVGIGPAQRNTPAAEEWQREFLAVLELKSLTDPTPRLEHHSRGTERPGCDKNPIKDEFLA